MTKLSYLEEARQVRHQLMIGKSVSVVQKDGRRIQYTPANLPELERYIEALESASAGKSFRRGPARVRF